MTDDETFTSHPDLLLMQAAWDAAGEDPCVACGALWLPEVVGGGAVLIREHVEGCPLG